MKALSPQDERQQPAIADVTAAPPADPSRVRPMPVKERQANGTSNGTANGAAVVEPQLDTFNTHNRDWGLRRALYWELMRFARNRLGFVIARVGVGTNMRRPADAEEPEIEDGYETRIVGLEDLLPYIGRVPGVELELLEEIFSHNDECAANFYNGELVGYGFQSRSRTRVTNQLDVIIPDGFRYGYKDWTHPDHRRKRLTKIRGYVRFTTMPRPIEERAVWYVETHNYASRLHTTYQHPRDRGIHMGYVGYFSLFGRQIPFATRRAKWIGFVFVRRGDTRPRQYIQ